MKLKPLVSCAASTLQCGGRGGAPFVRVAVDWPMAQTRRSQGNATQRNATQRNATQHNTTKLNTTAHNTTQATRTAPNAAQHKHTNLLACDNLIAGRQIWIAG